MLYSIYLKVRKISYFLFKYLTTKGHLKITNEVKDVCTSYVVDLVVESHVTRTKDMKMSFSKLKG